MASLSSRDLDRILRKAGCELRREGAKHEVWYSPITGSLFTVPRTLKGEGTLRKILKDAGVRRR